MTQGVLLIVLAGLVLSAHVLAQGLVQWIVAGSSWAVGPRDDLPPRETVLSRRLHRAMVNYAETLPICLTIFIAAELSGRSGDAVLYGGWVWLGCRIVYLPAYAFGIHYLRSIAWSGAITALIVMMLGLLLT